MCGWTPNLLDLLAKVVTTCHDIWSMFSRIFKVKSSKYVLRLVPRWRILKAQTSQRHNLPSDFPKVTFLIDSDIPQGTRTWSLEAPPPMSAVLRTNEPSWTASVSQIGTHQSRNVCSSWQYFSGGINWLEIGRKELKGTGIEWPAWIEILKLIKASRNLALSFAARIWKALSFWSLWLSRYLIPIHFVTCSNYPNWTPVSNGFWCLIYCEWM